LIDGQSTRSASSEADAAARPQSRGITAVGVFLFFGAAMAAFAGTTLLWPGTRLDRAWALNPDAYKTLRAFGRVIGIPFLTLSAALLAAGVGWFHRRAWGWRLAVAIIAIQLFGDGVSALEGHFARGAAGVAIAGALLFYLFRPSVRTAFQESP
jgi:hypothetical protein